MMCMMCMMFVIKYRFNLSCHTLGGCKKYLLALQSGVHKVKSKKRRGIKKASTNDALEKVISNEKYTHAKTAKENASVSQKERLKTRGSPEAGFEIFQRRGKSKLLSTSSVRTLQFFRIGGSADYEGMKRTFSNTCNFDVTLMILQSIWSLSELGKQFIESNVKNDAKSSKVLSCIEMICDGRSGDAKLHWWVDVLDKKITGSLTDMLGSELFNHHMHLKLHLPLKTVH
jgi:hypothetical protein